MKKTVSLLLAFLFVFLMSACGAKEDETTTAKTTEAAPATETTVPEITRTQAEIDEIIAGIKKACVLSTVLDKYGSYVSEWGILEIHNDGYHFIKDGKFAYVEREEICYVEPTYDVYYDEDHYKCAELEERYGAYFYLDSMSLYSEPDDRYELSKNFVDGDDKIFYPENHSCFNLIKETEDYYYFSTYEDVTDTDSYEPGIYRFDKKTLLPYGEEFADIDSYYHCYYGVDYEKEDKIIDDCLGEHRKVTVIKEYHEDGEIFTDEATVEIPATWEIYFDYSSLHDIEVYMDAEHTVEYSYPGDGVDYTVYVKETKHFM